MPSSWYTAGGYRYTQDLMQLRDARPPESAQGVPPELEGVSSPLLACLAAWCDSLRHHPDAVFASYVIEGLQHGFKIGFDYSCPLQSATRNMGSATSHPEVVDAYIQGEVSRGRMLGPLPQSMAEGLHVNRMGVIPKGHAPGKWRLITDLSFPERGNVNDGIDEALCSLQYTSVERIAVAAQALGDGALMAKLDVQSAYRLLPVHPTDRALLGIEWRGELYADGMLPFGLRSAPKIFTAVADALEWIVRRRGVRYVDHYLDDYITFGAPRSGECAEALDTICQACADLGVPLAMDKLEGPSTRLTFLGIEVDMGEGVLRLPQDKLARLRAALGRWSDRRSCTKRELQSLIGTLQHACRVVRPGRAFLRQMIDLLRIPRRPHHHVRLNSSFRADLRWWSTFVAQWNGVAVVPPSSPPGSTMTSDASGHWGCGAWHGREWFQYQWPSGCEHHHIAYKELFAALLACATWGAMWRGKRILWRCDNQAAVHAIGRRSCRDSTLMHLIRCLFFFEAVYQFNLEAEHLPGRDNILADDLSRDRRLSFLSKAPHMRRDPAVVPPLLPAALLANIDWTSPRWIETFTASLIGV